MAYIDGFLIPVRTNDRERYRDHELKWWKTFKDLGALTMVAGWGDEVPAGKHTDFQRAVALQDDETVVFCWLTWPDKETRTRAYEKMMAETADTDTDMPFDGKRMVFGGFTALIDES